MKHLLLLCAVTSLLVAVPASALEMRPGLWEMSSDDIQVDGNKMPGMAEMVEQMKALPPEQRKMMEDMLAAQGVVLGAGGVRMCLSAEQIKSRELPFQDEPGCSQNVTEQTGDPWRFSFECPDAKGTGETRLISDREVASVIDSQYRTGDQEGSSRIQSQGRWLSDDCGTLEPRK